MYVKQFFVKNSHFRTVPHPYFRLVTDIRLFDMLWVNTQGE